MDVQVTKVPEREIHPTNFLHDFVEFSRSKQVLNEEQACAMLLVVTTGLLPNHKDYDAAFVTGGSSGGKTHMNDEVVKKAFALKLKEWIYTITGGSDKSMIDDPEWNEKRIAILNELNKIPEPLLEFFKSVHGDDGGNVYNRNIPDSEAEGGRTTVKLKSKPMPVTFMLADENKMQVEAELKTRMVEIKVDETEDKNAGVHDMHWGKEKLTVAGTEHNYIWDDPELQYAVQYHISNIPVDTDVLLPIGEGRFDGDDWYAGAVTKPMFEFKRSQSTRASRMIKSMVKASALLNYHARPRVTMVDDDGEAEEFIVAGPEDVANVIAIRKTLMTLTHGLDEKKLAILDAIIDVGGAANKEGTKLQATRKQIEDALQEDKSISTMSKSEVKKHLEEMNEMYLIDITENPNDRREHLYVYGGGDSLGRPAINEYPSLFAGVMDPILDIPIEQTIQAQQERLGAKNPADVLSQEASVEPQETLTDDLTDLEVEVLDLMKTTMQDNLVRPTALDALEWEHMLGVAPLSTDGDYIEAERPVKSSDLTGTLFDPKHGMWKGHSQGEVRSEIADCINNLKQKGQWQLKPVGDDFTVSFK